MLARRSSEALLAVTVGHRTYSATIGDGKLDRAEGAPCERAPFLEIGMQLRVREEPQAGETLLQASSLVARIG